MLYSERAVTSMAKRLVLLFQQITVCYSFVTNSESGHDRLLFTVECFSCVAQSLFQVWKYLVSLFQSYCQIVPMYIFILGLRSDKQTCEPAAKLDVKAVFAHLSAFSSLAYTRSYEYLKLRWQYFAEVEKLLMNWDP